MFHVYDCCDTLIVGASGAVGTLFLLVTNEIVVFPFPSSSLKSDES